MAEMQQQFIYLIKDLGFPIAMCLYFMWVNNTTIKKNTEALIGLKEYMILKR